MLDNIQPGTTGWNEMHMKPRVLLEPGNHLRMFVCGVVVYDQMQVEFLWCLFVDQFQKSNPLLMTMSLLAGSDDLALGRVNRGKQGGCTVPLVIVSHGAAAASVNREALLRAVQGLNLGLFIATEHERVFGWIKVQAHDVPQLLRELPIVRQLEGLDQMRLQTICGPHPLHGGLAHTHGLSHRPSAPMRGPFRFFLRRLVQNQFDRACGNRRIATRTRRIFFNALNTLRRKSRSPQRDGLLRGLQACSDRLIHLAFSRRQNNLCSQHATCRRAPTTRPSFQRLPLLARQLDCALLYAWDSPSSKG